MQSIQSNTSILPTYTNRNYGGGQVAQVLYISMPFLSTKQQHQSTDNNHVKSSTDLILS